MLYIIWLAFLSLPWGLMFACFFVGWLVGARGMKKYYKKK